MLTHGVGGFEIASTKRKVRVLIGKPGLNGHDRGAKVVAMALRDAGMEVIYTGRHSTPKEIVSAATQEDVDVIGLSMLSGAHLYLAQEVLRILEESGGDVSIIVGGVIPEKDIPALKKIGVAEVFPVGSNLDDIINRIKRLAEKRGRNS